MPPQKLTITIECESKEYKLFSIIEKKSGSSKGDIGIYINHAINAWQTLGRRSVPEKIQEEHFTVHRSMKSPSNINAIKHTISYKRGHKQENANYTEALKVYNNISLIYTCWCRDLRSENKYLSESTEQLSISSINFDRFSLYYTLCVAKLDRKFNWPEVNDINFHEIECANFRVAILYSFIPIPATTEGHKRVNSTIPPEQIPENLKEMMHPVTQGGDEADIILQHRENISYLRIKHFESAVKLGKTSGDEGVSYNQVRPLKSGIIGEEFHTALKAVQAGAPEQQTYVADPNYGAEFSSYYEEPSGRVGLKLNFYKDDKKP